MKVADEIIQVVCDEHDVDVSLVLQSGIRTRIVKAARHDAILRLRAAGFSVGWIAGAMRMSRQCVNYHVYPNCKTAVNAGWDRWRARQSEARA